MQLRMIVEEERVLILVYTSPSATEIRAEVPIFYDDCFFICCIYMISNDGC